MNENTTVNAGDIARLVDVGRAAVSNWRRRYQDFPEPVGGTASSPLFSLPEIEEWLRRNGKAYRVSLADRAWQRLRAGSDDLRLGDLVALAGTIITGDNDTSLRPLMPTADWTSMSADPVLQDLIIEFAHEQGPAAAFELLCARYAAAHSRQLVVTPPEIVEILVDLVDDADTVLDPACGLGSLLYASRARWVLGQELVDSAAMITASRLALDDNDRDITVVPGDSLRQDGFPGKLADAVVCDPPFNERSWGHAELTGDPRWAYGLPPRGESELAWVQHCLAHTRPGGLVAILMPPAAASRRPGKRIRGNLLRAGALRAVISLGSAGPDLWLLRRPISGERPSSHLLLMSAEHDLDAVVPACRRQLADPDGAGGVRIVELLDDDVDVSPARRRPGDGRQLADEFADALARLRAAVPAPPDLVALDERRDLPTTTLGELARADLVSIQPAPVRMATDGDLPVLTADDLAEGRPPSGRTTEEPGQVTVNAGDVVASVQGAARVMTEGGAVLGPYLTRYRVDPDRLDPDYLAGLLRSADTHPGASRIDARRLRVPRLPLDEQRAYGAAFRGLAELEDVLRVAVAAGGTLVRLGFDGLIAGHLRPGQ
jgi:N-6 DNA Methylase